MMRKNRRNKKIYHGYYEGPRPNRYEGWADEEIEEDIRKAEERDAKLTSWEEAERLGEEEYNKFRRGIINYDRN